MFINNMMKQAIGYISDISIGSGIGKNTNIFYNNKKRICQPLNNRLILRMLTKINNSGLGNTWISRNFEM